MAAEKTPRVQALAGLAVYTSLMEALLKRGISEQDDVRAITKEAATNVPGFCTGFEAEVEKETKHLLTMIGKAGFPATPERLPEDKPVKSLRQAEELPPVTLGSTRSSSSRKGGPAR
jgi:hypothetical protein